MIAPCKSCADRYPACHDRCERYAEYKAEQAKIKKAKRYDYIGGINYSRRRLEIMRGTKR